MSKLKTFILGSIEELSQKVTWPHYQALHGSAVLVLITSFLFSLVVGGMDVSLKRMITFFYQAF